jgi:pimeloyl-ACP methyl ester carboxylesterase
MKNFDLDSTPTEVTRPDGLAIRCLVEAPARARPDAPLVIVVPPYAKTMREVMVTALYLTYNGFRVWRFDFANHVGASDGNVFNFTLSSAVVDVRAVIAAARDAYGNTPVGVVSSSLGSRAAFRALKGYEDLGVLVSLVGVVNVRHTLVKIMGEDLVGDLLKNQLAPGSRDVLGYEVSTRFINDVVEGDFHSLESTKLDLSACPFAAANISAGSDAWTLPGEVEEVFLSRGGGAARELYTLPGASHKLENNPSAARDALRQTVRVLKQRLTGDSVQPDDVSSPSFPDIVAKNRRERAWERSGYPLSGLKVCDQVSS